MSTINNPTGEASEGQVARFTDALASISAQLESKPAAGVYMDADNQKW